MKRHVPWAYAIGFTVGALITIWVPVRILPWPLAIAGGIGLFLLASTSARIGDLYESRIRLHGTLLAAYAGGALLINSIWPLVLLIPVIQVIRQWPEVRESGGREGP